MMSLFESYPATISFIVGLIFGIILYWLSIKANRIGVIHVDVSSEESDKFLFEFTEDPSYIARHKGVFFDVHLVKPKK